MLEHKQEACMLLQKKCVLVKKKQQNFLPKKNLSLKRLHCSAWRKKKPQEIFTDWFSSTSSFWKNRQNLSLMCSQLYFPGVAIVFVLGFFWHFLSWNYVNNIAKSPCVLLLLACCHSTSSRRCTGWHWVLLLWRGLCPGLAVTGDSKRFIPSWALFLFIRSDLYPPRREEVIHTLPRWRYRQCGQCAFHFHVRGVSFFNESIYVCVILPVYRPVHPFAYTNLQILIGWELILTSVGSAQARNSKVKDCVLPKLLSI